MKRLALALGLVLFALDHNNAHAAQAEIVFQSGDAQALEVANKIVADEIAKAGATTTILTASVKLSDTEAPYLFVKLRDRYHCGNVNCEVWGFRKTNTGWQKVFSGSGEQWNVLASSHNGHYDLSKTMHGGSSVQETSIYRWAGGRYRRIG
jgi:hypothetical protein